MTTSEKPPTARELGLMAGFPPAADKTVSHAQQLLAPYNRWSFQNELPLNRVVDVWRGSGPVADFVDNPYPVEQVPYQNRLGQRFTFGEMVERTYTDGILVLQDGQIRYERYLNGMQPHTLHAWASGSKSVVGVLAADLAHAGRIDPAALVSDYLPELSASGFAGATLQQVMDMTTGVGFAAGDAPNLVAESDRYGIALGWVARPDGYTGPSSVYEILPEMVPAGVHGHHFTYLTPNTDVLAWVIKRVLNQSLAEIMHERLWSRLGVERDAFWIVDPGMAETAGSGLVTTLRDMARFGQMLLQKGHFNGQQILPDAVVDDLQAGADPAAFARGPAAGPTNQGWSYHHQWWLTHNNHQAYLGLGYGGQMLYIDPTARMVIAKFSSYPTPTPAGNEFYGPFAAFPFLGSVLAAEES